VSDDKAAARIRAAERRARAHDAAAGTRAAAHLSAYLEAFAGRVLAGYLPIRTEIDPRPVLAAWSGPVALPVVEAPRRPLVFRGWRPGDPLVRGSFGVPVPEAVRLLVPEVLIVPLLAFDGRGYRLGYGGGFYDRTLAALRGAGRPVAAVGFAYAAQRADALPTDATDVRLDAVVTEDGPEVFGAG
jgi:5-formyltetrahydrofolate cyclo-ligase